MIGLVYASAWALKDKDEEPEAYGAVEKPMGIENEGMKPTFAKSMGMKSGRVLSAKNLSRIKAAQQHLTDVMKSLPMEQQPPDSAPNEQGTKSASVLFTLVDDPAPQEPTYRIEKDVLKAVINEAMAASITAPTVEKFQRSLDMARGRVY
jgi:hypothetical protein